MSPFSYGSEDPSAVGSRNSWNGGPSTHIPSVLRRPVSSSGATPFSPITAPPPLFNTSTPYHEQGWPPLPPPLRAVARTQTFDHTENSDGLGQARPSPVPLACASLLPRAFAMQAEDSSSRIDDRATNFSPAVRSPSSASPLSSPGPSEDEDDEKEMALDEQEIEADDEGVPDEQKASARGPNTSVNYKIKFQKARERYNRIQADSASLLKGLQDAQKKEKKLEEEINWLLDTLASRRPDLARLEH